MPKRKAIKNLGASVRARLTTLSTKSGQQFDLLLTRFAIERLLHGRATSPHAQSFVPEGTMLLINWLHLISTANCAMMRFLQNARDRASRWSCGLPRRP